MDKGNMTRGVSTGVTPLDRKLDGGIPAGTVTTLLADPASQAELLLTELTARSETLYLSSERAPTAVTAGLQDQCGEYEDVTVSRLARDQPVIDAIARFEEIPESGLVIVDPLESLEQADAGQYRAFLEKLQAVLAQTESVAVLHALKHADPPAQRHRTTYMSDLIFDLVTDTSDDAVDSQLLVPKFRGGSALTDAVSLKLTDRIAVDTSRDIA